MKTKIISESLENFLSESLQFQRGGDPRQVLNIRQRAQIEEWFSYIEDKIGRITYTIDDKLNIVVNHSLALYGLDIDWIPDNLTVKGYLDLRYTKITKLPNNLKVGGGLYLRNTKITELPDNLKIKGDLYLNNTNITKLPDNLSVNGYLDLQRSKITKLPNNLSVKEILDLRNTKITELPDSLRVRGNIWISKNMKNSLIVPNHLKNKIKNFINYQ